MEDRYTAMLTPRVGRDLARRERYLLAVPLLARLFTLNLTVVTAMGAGLGSFASADSAVPAWVGGAFGAVIGAAAAILVSGTRQRSKMPPGYRRLSTVLALVVTDRRLLFYRRTVGGQARQLLAEIPRSVVTAITVGGGSFLQPRPVEIRLEDGTVLQFEGARADSVGMLAALD